MAEIPKELLDILVKDCSNIEDLLGKNSAFRQLKKALIERVLDAEMSEHLGYEKGDPAGKKTGNSRNGRGKKTILTESGTLELEPPRDRNGTFEPTLVQKRQVRLPGFDEKVISLYARGLSVREIQGHLLEIYESDVSADLISRVTDAVLEEVTLWQNRPLAAVWPVVYLDALVLKIRHGNTVQNKAVYLALGINLEGTKEVLGIWVSENEGAKFWLSVVTELRTRGVSDILIACCDGLKGFPEAIESVFPKTMVQTCIVHRIRNSLQYVSYKDYRAITADLKPIYQATTVTVAEQALDAFEEKWASRYPMIARSWRNNWSRVVPFFAFAPEIRRAIYTTNAIESLNRQLRKVLKTRGVFPTDESAVKLLWLALQRASLKWTMPIQDWGRALQQLAIHFEGRLPL